MLTELRIKDLGVIAGLEVFLRPGMTVVTGETGAGKTLLVQAIDLLLGGRADGLLVRAGAVQAEVEGRFVDGDEEIVLARVVPASGRSRAYLDGRMAPATALSEAGARLVDLHGQHAHQSLLSPAAQRAALDAFGGIDLAPASSARRRLKAVEAELASLGGDERARAREADLLAFQIDELAAARLANPSEDEELSAEEDRLAQAAAHRHAAAKARELLTADGGAADAVGLALAALDGHQPLADMTRRLLSVSAEVADAVTDLRRCADALGDDPERLEEIRMRRVLLRELRRKYGETLGDVMAYAEEAASRLVELQSHVERVAALEEQRQEVQGVLVQIEGAVGAARRAAADGLGRAVAGHLQELAMAGARFEVRVGADGIDDVSFLLAANPGEPALPLSRVASGGELARTMLALRLVVGEAGLAPTGQSAAALGASTLVFDEVDAGVGGEAALAVGRALAAVASGTDAPQVLVVTHLAQVAAFADHQLAVGKEERDGRTVVDAAHLEGEARVVELSRMLSGQPDSTAARGHAQELLSVASRRRRA